MHDFHENHKNFQLHKDLPLEVHGTCNIVVQPLRILDQTVVVEPKILSILVAKI